MSDGASLTYRKPDLRALLTLAWPIVVSRAAQTVVGFADAVMIAPLGEDALAAVTTGAMNAFLAFIFPMGVVYIVGSFAAQLHGGGDGRGARRFGIYALFISLGAEALSLAVILGIPGLVDHFGVTPVVAQGLTTYLRIRMLAGGLVVGLEGLGAYYGAIGNTRLPMITQVIAMVMNVILNGILIHGVGPIPAMGIAGAAWASVVATGIGFVVLLYCFVTGIGTGAKGKITGVNAREFFRVIRFGVPSGLNWFLEFAAFMYFVDVIVAGLGTTALAAFMAVLQLNSMSFMPAFGIASSGAVFVGQAIGANAKDDVSGIVKLTAAVSATWQGVVGVLYLLLPTILILPFVGDESKNVAFVALAVVMLRISSAWQLFDSVATVLSEALRSAGDTVFPLIARLAIAWLFFTPLATFAVDRTGSPAIATTTVVAYLAALALVLFLRFRSGAWRRITLVDHGPTLMPPIDDVTAP